MIKQIIAFLLMAMIPLCLCYGAEDNIPSWKKYSFNGKEFHDGAASSGLPIYQRNGFLPVIGRTPEALRESKLPPGTGGLVIFCYLQSSGGKLESSREYVPAAGAAVNIQQGSWTMMLRTDGEGYAILALPADTYELTVQGITRKARLERGKTAFIPIRTGKRMTD